MEELSPEAIKTLREHPVFIQLVKHITFKIYELDTLDGMEELSDQQAAEKAKSHALAIRKLLEIFKPLIEDRHKRELTDEEIEQAKGKFGLA